MTPAAEKAAPPTQTGWFALAGLTLGLIAVYGPVLLNLARQWNNDEDMGHGFFVPLVAGYIVWQKREQLRGVAMEPCWWGLVLMVLAAIQSQAGSLGAELFLSRTAFLFSLIGLVLFVGGKHFTRALAFPLLLLFFMIPIPAIVYTRITFPLQLIASRTAEVVLHILQIPVLRNGNVLELSRQTLSVVEACSGIRSLLSLGFLSLVYGFFFEPRRWVRAALFVAAVPIAIGANAFRVTITGVLSEYKPELAEGFFHTAEGWVIFMVALAMLIAFHALLGRIFRTPNAAR